ncbi:hypothetical protein Tsubulata_016681 [Turnera subulata]|uniref:RRM domain-containing protein n=1 Tax=Turnera subulata TaxID=218843 RepID=A0A9Q0JCY9_9ROSI|nr:hypothetical protein Tsubulata_016681 [Turnera subulata]
MLIGWRFKPKQLYFSKWNRKVIQCAIDNNSVVSMYVANIPTRWEPIDLHLFMSRFGDVMDVFTPMKPNRSGNRYSFVRFKNNIPMATLIQHLNSIQVDGATLNASVARNRVLLTSICPVALPQHLVYNEIEPDKWFARVVLSCVMPPPLMTPSALPVEQAFIPKSAGPAWLHRCAFGIPKSPMPFSSVSAIASITLPKVDKVIPMSWKTGDTATDRLCWLLVRGTPPSAWSVEFFRVLASKHGSFLDWSSYSMTSTNQFNNSVFSVSVDGMKCDIGVMESQYDPLDWEWSSPQPPSAAVLDGVFSGTNNLRTYEEGSSSSFR